MNKNNYDRSSTGYNCELTVMLDCDVSRMRFKDEFHTHQHDGYSTTCVLQFGIEQIEPVSYVSDLFEFSDGISQKHYRNALYSYVMSRCETYYYTARNFFDEYGYGPGNTDWKEAFMSELDNESIADYAKESGSALIDCLESGVTHKFRVKASRGHSQGDYALVLIPNENGWDGQHEDVINEHIDNMIWNFPVYARLEITDQDTGETDEIHLEEFLDSSYDWDRDKVIDGLKKREPALPQSVMEWVEENLPEYLE